MSEISKISERMPVVAADGRAIGFVTAVGGDGLRVTSIKDGRGFTHRIPLDWIAKVDKYVFLDKASHYVAANCSAPGAKAA
jgi:hypothetical protein